MNRWGSDDGGFSLEFIALIPLLLFVAAFSLQILTVVAAGTAATTAARDGSRAQGLPGRSCNEAVAASLPSWLQDGHTHTCGASDGTVRVRVRVPTLFAGVPSPAIHVTREATLPDTRP
jgi:hypothetical protein